MKKAKIEVLKMQKERDWKQFHSPENLAKSIVIESGELLECFQWNSNYNHDEAVEELADILNYCILMADALNVDLEQIVLDKIEKNKKKYPVEQAKGVSTKYNKFVE
ncbi:MAG: nucleotide pyrophosphohydrolase [Candidatus Cloacimonetes bacterium]|nr:nucleotide pyrophosphohydrolase [Candidatus Cloacimonadota bacterium]